MKLHVRVHDIDETFEAADATAMLHVIKREVEKRAPMLMRPLVRGMSDMRFAAEVVKRAGQQKNHQDPTPATPEQFLEWAVSRGYASVEDK